MKKSILVLFLMVFSLLIFNPNSWSQELVCVEANGLNWCYNPNQCGQACNDVCAVDGMVPIADNTIWLEAQNTLEKCNAISQAFGLGNSGNLGSFVTQCLEDQGSAPHGPGLNTQLFCSFANTCPEAHRTDMAALGVPCDSLDFPRRSICPCEPPPPSTAQVPTLSEWGMIAMVGILGIVGFMVIRRKKNNCLTFKDTSI
jgi:hypothetical protein